MWKSKLIYHQYKKKKKNFLILKFNIYIYISVFYYLIWLGLILEVPIKTNMCFPLLKAQERKKERKKEKKNLTNLKVLFVFQNN